MVGDVVGLEATFDAEQTVFQEIQGRQEIAGVQQRDAPPEPERCPRDAPCVSCKTPVPFAV